MTEKFCILHACVLHVHVARAICRALDVLGDYGVLAGVYCDVSGAKFFVSGYFIGVCM